MQIIQKWRCRIAYTFLKFRLWKRCTLFINNTTQSRHSSSIINKVFLNLGNPCKWVAIQNTSLTQIVLRGKEQFLWTSSAKVQIVILVGFPYENYNIFLNFVLLVCKIENILFRFYCISVGLYSVGFFLVYMFCLHSIFFIYLFLIFTLMEWNDYCIQSVLKCCLTKFVVDLL